MSRIQLDIPPDPSKFATTPAWQTAMYNWALTVKSRIEQHSRKADVPVAQFQATAFTTNTTASGQNAAFSLVVTIPITTPVTIPVALPARVIIPGVAVGTATITATSTTTGTVTATGTSTSTVTTTTSTLTDLASANVLATLVQDLINYGILSPSATR